MPSNTLNSPLVAATLDALFADADRNDPAVFARAQQAMAALGTTRNDQRISAILDDAYMPVAPEVGRLLYLLVRAHRPETVVEFGTSFGISAIHLAAGLRDNGTGRLIATELNANKVTRARQNLDAAGLADLVELRQGDAFETLRDGPERIDLLLLDGWKELYLPLLQALEPRLAPGALVLADDIHLLPDALAPYLAYVRAPDSGYVSVAVPLDDGIELSLRTA